jgi:hypothetical protein
VAAAQVGEQYADGYLALLGHAARPQGPDGVVVPLPNAMECNFREKINKKIKKLVEL